MDRYVSRSAAACWLGLFLLCPPLGRVGVVEQTFTVPLGQLFVRDQHGGPTVRMRVGNASVVDMNYVDEFGRLWGGALLSFANWHLKIRLASS